MMMVMVMMVMMMMMVMIMMMMTCIGRFLIKELELYSEIIVKCTLYCNTLCEFTFQVL